MQIQSYLNFDGRCEEALEFYKAAIGAKVQAILRFADNADACASLAKGNETKVMHSAFTVGETTLMASDCQCKGQPRFQGISLSINPKSEAEARQLFGALSEGGQVQMALAPAFFSPCFGVVADRFGVCWMVAVMP